MMGTYHHRSGGHFDFALMWDNFSEAFTKEGMGVIYDTFKVRDWRHSWIFAFVLTLLQWRFKLFSRVKPQHHFKVLGLIILQVLIIVSPWHVYDEITSFQQSAYRYFYPEDFQTKMSKQLYKQSKYPFAKIIKANSSSRDLPNIFIVFMESFNANVVDKEMNGKELTPYFNKLKTEGIYLENFYANSIQTSKGHMASFCSLIPLVQGKINYLIDGLELNCLPEILKGHGYHNYFFQGYHDLNFDNSFNFFKSIGFNHVVAMNPPLVTPDEFNKYRWGWGIQDNITYRKVFQVLDEHFSNNEEKPVFAAVATISNHTKFRDIPTQQHYIFSNPQDMRERYANSVRVADEYLKTFFVELKRRKLDANSIVIITGDHSFPFGEHDNFNNQSFAYEENFKTPFLILLPEKMSVPVSKNVNKLAYSQLDTAPTILDLLGIKSSNHFLGSSIFNNEQIARDIFLVQPYDGTYVGVINWPYKYLLHLRSKREFLYNLKKDNREDINLINSGIHALSHLREKIGIIFLNQKLATENKFWPKSDEIKKLSESVVR